MPPIIGKLMQNPKVLGTLGKWYRNLPKSFGYGPIGRPLERGDIHALEDRFRALFGRLSPNQQQKILTRAMDGTSPASASDDVIRVGAIDVSGEIGELVLQGHIDSDPISLSGLSLHHVGRGGLNYFRDPETGDRIVVFNGAGQAEDMDGALLGGRLPARHVVDALFPQTLFTDETNDRVTLLSHISVPNVPDFDPDVTYAGYRVRNLPEGQWIPLRNIVTVEGSASREKDGKRVRVLFSDGAAECFDVKFLENLLAGMRDVHYAYRRVGGVPDLLAGGCVNVETGEVVIEPGTAFYLMDVGLIAPEDDEATDIHDEVEKNLFTLQDEFFPGIAPRVLANEHIRETAVYHLARFGGAMGAVEQGALTTEEIVGKMLNKMGMVTAAIRFMSSEKAEPHEKAAFLDYLASAMDRKILNWIRAGRMRTEADKVLNDASSATQGKTSIEALFQSLRAWFDIGWLPTAVGVDDVAAHAYEDIRDVFGESLYNEDHQSLWHDLLTAYYVRHGLSQIDMFFAREIPLALIRSALDPLGRSFHDFAMSRIDSFHPISTGASLELEIDQIEQYEMENRAREILTWETFGDEVRNLLPDDGTHGPRNGWTVSMDDLSEALHRDPGTVAGLTVVDLAGPSLIRAIDASSALFVDP